MRNIDFAPGEYYHVFNRGNSKQKLFLDKRDYVRFLFLLLYQQSHVPVYNISQAIDYFLKNNSYNVRQKQRIIDERIVELVNFCIMPNHFHILVKECEENGITNYVHRFETGFSKYYNIRYRKSGHVFQGTFKAVHVESNEQLLHLSAYIHKNPEELMRGQRGDKYSWSTYRDYAIENRWGDLLVLGAILDQFKNKKEYRTFVQETHINEKYVENINY